MLAVLFLVLFFVGEPKEGDEDAAGRPRRPTPDAYAGGFPVPPLPTGGAVRGAAAPLEFRTRADEPVPATATTGEES